MDIMLLAIGLSILFIVGSFVVFRVIGLLNRVDVLDLEVKWLNCDIRKLDYSVKELKKEIKQLNVG